MMIWLRIWNALVMRNTKKYFWMFTLMSEQTAWLDFKYNFFVKKSTLLYTCNQPRCCLILLCKSNKMGKEFTILIRIKMKFLFYIRQLPSRQIYDSYLRPRKSTWVSSKWTCRLIYLSFRLESRVQIPHVTILLPAFWNNPPSERK